MLICRRDLHFLTGSFRTFLFVSIFILKTYIFYNFQSSYLLTFHNLGGENTRGYGTCRHMGASRYYYHDNVAAFCLKG